MITETSSNGKKKKRGKEEEGEKIEREVKLLQVEWMKKAEGCTCMWVIAV